MRRIVGLDLGGTNIKAVLVTFEAGDTRVESTHTRSTDGHLGPEQVVTRLADAARAVTSIDPSDWDAVGVTVPGTFDRSTGTIGTLPNLPGWDGIPIVELLSEDLGTPVALINDSRAFTLAEGSLGAGRGARVVAGLTLGTGIGGGILYDGTLHVGASGSAGEFGHQVISADGPACGCGGRGCLEALARPPVVAAMAGRSDFEDTMRAYRSGDERAVAAIGSMVDHLGIGLANILTVLGPDRIVVGGGAAQAGDLLVAIRESAAAHARLVPDDTIDIAGASLGPEAGAIGAALFASQQVDGGG